MTELFRICLLLLVVAIVVSDDAPLCSKCRYASGPGFHPHETHCGAFYMCERSALYPSGYTRYLMCCENGTVWDQRLLTCNYPEATSLGNCTMDYFTSCPVTEDPEADDGEVTEAPCLFLVDPNNPFGFIWPVDGVDYIMDCAPGTVFNISECDCVFNPDYVPPPPCDRLMYFDFTNDDDSLSCNTFVAGYHVYQEAPQISNGSLCFDGRQFLEFNYLNNWFPHSSEKKINKKSAGNTFTISFWFTHDGVANAGNGGLFSTNCRWSTEGSNAEFIIFNNEMYVVLGTNGAVPTGKVMELGNWYHTGVTYDHGDYVLYFNGEVLFRTKVKDPLISSQTATTIGYVEDELFLHGCMDDVSFYTIALTEDEMVAQFVDGRSD